MHWAEDTCNNVHRPSIATQKMRIKDAIVSLIHSNRCSGLTQSGSTTAAKFKALRSEVKIGNRPVSPPLMRLCATFTSMS